MIKLDKLIETVVTDQPLDVNTRVIIRLKKGKKIVGQGKIIRKTPDSIFIKNDWADGKTQAFKLKSPEYTIGVLY